MGLETLRLQGIPIFWPYGMTGLCWAVLLSLCSCIAVAGWRVAADTSLERLEVAAFCTAMPARCPTGAAPSTAADLRTEGGHTRKRVAPPPRQAVPPPGMPRTPALSAASAPPEDPSISACRYLGLQTEWVASNRDAGLPLAEALAAYRRVFALDLPWQHAVFGAIGTLVYQGPQRSPQELRQAIEAACLTHPLLWTKHAYN